MEQVVSFLFNHREALFSKSQFGFGLLLNCDSATAFNSGSRKGWPPEWQPALSLLTTRNTPWIITRGTTEAIDTAFTFVTAGYADILFRPVDTPGSDHGDIVVWEVPHVCGACAHTVSRSIPLNMDPAVSLGGVNAADGAPSLQSASAACNNNSAGAEAEVAGDGIDQHHIALIGIIGQKKTECGHSEPTSRRAARSISRPACHSSCT